MSGLLDIWEQWRNSSGYGETTGSSTDFSKRKVNRFNRTDLSTAGGTNETNQDTSLKRTYKRGQFPPTDPKYIRENPEVRNRLGKVIEPGSQLPSSEGGFQTRFK